MHNAHKRRQQNEEDGVRLGSQKTGDIKSVADSSSKLSTSRDPMRPEVETPNQTYDFERLLDATETAKLLHCHVKTLERYARQGTVPAYRIHGRWYFRASDLDSWLRAQVKLVRHPCRVN
jgi:excisionase family DNA binding protein